MKKDILKKYENKNYCIDCIFFTLNKVKNNSFGKCDKNENDSLIHRFFNCNQFIKIKTNLK